MTRMDGAKSYEKCGILKGHESDTHLHGMPKLPP